MSEFDPVRRMTLKLLFFAGMDCLAGNFVSACQRFEPSSFPTPTSPLSNKGTVFPSEDSSRIFSSSPYVESKNSLPAIERLSYQLSYGIVQENTPVRKSCSLEAPVIEGAFFSKGALIRYTPYAKTPDSIIWGKVMPDSGFSNVQSPLNSEVFFPLSSVRKLSPQDLAPILSSVPWSLKRIEVILAEQMLEVYEGERIVKTFKVSTGKSGFSTPLGEYQITRVRLSRFMSGDGWAVAGVPYVMYFAPDQGLALHGAYWHNQFGRPVTHGCINLRPEEANWLFRWVYVPGSREKLLSQEELWISPKDSNLTRMVIKERRGP